jgi:DNA-binding NtrC family response regulator
MKALQTYHWPGNVRELEDFIERAVSLTQGQELFVSLAELTPTLSHTTTSGTTTLEQAEHYQGRDKAWDEADHASMQDAETRHRSPS